MEASLDASSMSHPAYRIALLILLSWTFACGGRPPNPPNVVASGPPFVKTYPTVHNPGALAIADLDGNGRLDIAVSNSDDDTIQLFLAASDGQLRPHEPSIPAGNDPSDLKAVDVDQDGDSDLVVANHETSNITVLINDGHAIFTAAAGSPYDSGARPHVHSVATGDFDGDHWNDIAVESADTREVRLIRGGPMGFREAEGIGVGTMPYFRLGAADVTGDGHVEILVPGNRNNTLIVVTGGREVLAEWTMSLPAQPWIAVGDDVSGDGRRDAIVIVTDGVERTNWLSVNDLDGDRRAELIVACGSPGHLAVVSTRDK